MMPAHLLMTLRPEPYLDWWNQATFAKLNQFAEIAEEFQVSMAGLASAWLAHHPDVTAPIVGPRRPQHFTAVKEALATTLTAESFERISKAFA